MAQESYFDLIAASYISRAERGLWGRIKAKEYAAVMAELTNKNFSRILDIGCGPGIYLLGIKRCWPDTLILGVDNSKNMVAQCRAQGLNVYHGNIQDLHLPQQKGVDTFLALGVLEFLAAPEYLLRFIQMHSSAKNTVILIVPKLNIFTFLYFFYHWLQGTNIFPRRIQKYKRLFGSRGYKLQRQKTLSVVSCLLVYKK